MQLRRWMTVDLGTSCTLNGGVWWRKLNLKAKVESNISHFSFKGLVPGGFNMGFIGSTCTASPG
jgi:hypothetical protein